MKKELLIFGSNGALGRGVTSTLLKKDFGKSYLFDFKHDEGSTFSNAELITIKDLTVEKNVEEAFSNVEPKKDTAFFLFSTVGGFAGGKKIWETEEKEINKMFDMNFRSSFFITKHFSQLVKESHSGSICFTAAFTGVQSEPGKAAYGASKGALIHMVKTLSLEGKEINLSANAIAPLIIDTPANREWMKNQNYDSWNKPEEIGELVFDIFKNYNFVTGNIIQLTYRFAQ